MLTRLIIEQGKLRLSDRVIFGLLAVAIVSPVNIGQAVPDTYFLTFGNERFVINEWWGRNADFAGVLASYPMPSVRLLELSDMADNPRGSESSGVE
jgi:hypothetical protein